MITKPIFDALEEVAVGDLTPSETVMAVRAILQHEDDAVYQRVYEVLRSVAWKKLSSRLTADEMTNWHDTFRQVAAFLEDRGAAVFDRILVLAELALESARFASMNAPEDMLRRPHVILILRTIEALGSDARRQAVQRRTGLGQANLSRILAHMISAGLVDRQQAGKEALLSLTSLARELLRPTPDGGSKVLDISPPLHVSAAA